jgi:catechol 2,3-dioxygenase-like lactoylglutathione lyase family enzyme
MISYSSAVLMTENFDLMTRFYQDLLDQKVRYDFGSCVQCECGLTVWRARVGHPVWAALESKGGGNAALELCFETEDFDAQAARIAAAGTALAHGVLEEDWGQRTLRFFDPDGNLVELGESMPAFCKRLQLFGMTVEEVAEKTGIDQNIVKHFLES